MVTPHDNGFWVLRNEELIDLFLGVRTRLNFESKIKDIS